MADVTPAVGTVQSEADSYSLQPTGPEAIIKKQNERKYLVMELSAATKDEKSQLRQFYRGQFYRSSTDDLDTTPGSDSPANRHFRNLNACTCASSVSLLLRYFPKSSLPRRQDAGAFGSSKSLPCKLHEKREHAGESTGAAAGPNPETPLL